MRPQEIIARKRDGNSLSDAEIGVFIDGVCTEAWADYQISALVMAMFINGLDQREQDELTRAMVYSGKVLDLASVDRPVVDKHSTGGVGDKTSLIIAPVAAACGLAVPMISGRGLGHTGGTLDKLESIEGFDVGLSMTTFTELLATNGYAMAGQTGEIAPADKKLYALRDATATVPYIPLIVASIMSKKLAEDLDALVLDVKTGSGAFMQKYEDSVRLAEALVQTGKAFGVNTQAVVSDMSQPLGKFVGNALEVYECIKLLRGEGDDAMSATLVLSVELTARMLLLGGIADSMSSAETMINEALASGKALAKFRENVEVQGGDPSVCDDPESLIDPTLKRIPFGAATSGYVAEVNTFAVGRAICDIGAGGSRPKMGSIMPSDSNVR
ncbi:MAG: thymidine phosphorylase [Chloracidobacterium sp.]|nr:thymidine phosphorylase [Chloracidobacterium sp.]